MRGIEGQRRLAALQDVIDPRAFFASALREANEIGRSQLPGRRGEHARYGNVVVGRGDQPEVGEDVLNQGMLKDREAGNHEGNLAAGELADEFVAMSVRAVQYGEIAPAAAGFVNALELGGYPAGFVFGSS